MTDSQLNRDDSPSIGAAPTSGLNIGGQRARNNLVNVDGTNAIDNSTNGVRSTVSQDAVQEFQIITNGYAAEYGQAAGGVINIISKSGHQRFPWQRVRIPAQPIYPGDKSIQQRRSAGLHPRAIRMTVGGPIKKDRTFCFFSFEGTDRHETGFNDIGADNFGLTSQADIIALRFGRAGRAPLPPGTVVVPVTPRTGAFPVEPNLPINPADDRIRTGRGHQRPGGDHR